MRPISFRDAMTAAVCGIANGVARARAGAGGAAAAASSAALILLTAQGAAAGTTDLRGLPDNFEQTSFGQTDTVLYAQSVIADDLYLSAAAARVRAENFSPDVLFNFMITGDRPDLGFPPGGLGFAPDLSDVRYSSGTLTAGQVMSDFTITPNIPVTPGERLFLVFDAFSYPASGLGVMEATEFGAAVDPYPAGEFVFFNQAGTGVTSFAEIDQLPWEHRSPENEDLAFMASFSATPEPASLGVLAVGGLGLLRRRRGK
jgi:MYXO-CTERM domain-containing protein